MRKFLNNPKCAILLALVAVTAVARAVMAGFPDRPESLPDAQVSSAGEPSTPPAAPIPAAPGRAVSGWAAALAAPNAELPEDPFARPDFAPSGAAAVILRVSALWQQGAETLAVVNGRIVRPGDVVAGVRIGEGLPDGLVLENRGRRAVVPVGGQWTSP